MKDAIEEITEILVRCQYAYWVEKSLPQTAELWQQQKQRAIDFYQVKGNKIDSEQTKFHQIINMQMVLIEAVLQPIKGKEQRLRQALRKYGCHEPDCKARIEGGDQAECTCGFEKALEAGK